MLNLSKDSDDLLYTVSLLHGFYGCYTAELSLKSVQFYGPGSKVLPSHSVFCVLVGGTLFIGTLSFGIIAVSARSSAYPPVGRLVMERIP
jgi:hypothetical protein